MCPHTKITAAYMQVLLPLYAVCFAHVSRHTRPLISLAPGFFLHRGKRENLPPPPFNPIFPHFNSTLMQNKLQSIKPSLSHLLAAIYVGVVLL